MKSTKLKESLKKIKKRSKLNDINYVTKLFVFNFVDFLSGPHIILIWVSAQEKISPTVHIQ